MGSNVCTFGCDELKSLLQQRGVPVQLISLGYLPSSWRCSRAVYKNGRCIFHAEDKDPIDFNKALIQELNIMANQDRYDFTGFISPKLDFSTGKFDKPVYFTGATFKDEVKFNKAVFNELAKFDGCEFQRISYFDEATFRNVASFTASTFKEEVRFTNAKFHGEANFMGASFQKSVFSGSEFKSSVTFRGSKFNEEAWFNNIIFNIADLENIRFKKQVWFFNAEFGGQVTFNGTEFRELALFIGSIFYGVTHFQLVVFRGGARFTKTIFNVVSFPYTTFQGTIVFVNCAFVGQAWFFNVIPLTHNSVLMFIGDPDRGTPDMKQFCSKIDEMVKSELEKNWGKDLNQLETVIQRGKISLRMVLFKGTDGRRIQFLNVEWDKKEVGPRCLRMKRNIIYDEKLLENSEGPPDYESVTRSYWGLCHNYERSGRYADAGDFYISEMEMRRLQTAPPPRKGKGSKPTVWKIIHRTISSWGWWRRNLLSPLAIYKYLSLYGESYVLASLWIFITVLLFTFLRAHLPSLGGQSTDLLNNLARSVFALFQLRGEETIDNIERIIGAILTGNLFIALRRRLERR
jgi:uncharacterized protein YjbI with pentapeptide repeats